MEAKAEQCFQDEERNQQCRDRDNRRASASRNLDTNFMEANGHKVFTTPYANVYALAMEVTAIQNPTDEQQRFKVILESTALQLQARNIVSVANPSWEPE